MRLNPVVPHADSIPAPNWKAEAPAARKSPARLNLCGWAHPTARLAVEAVRARALTSAIPSYRTFSFALNNCKPMVKDRASESNHEISYILRNDSSKFLEGRKSS